jgi:hypothetical protein
MQRSEKALRGGTFAGERKPELTLLRRVRKNAAPMIVKKRRSEGPRDRVTCHAKRSTRESAKRIGITTQSTC